MQKSVIKELTKEERSVAQQLHDIRVSKQLELEDVYHATKIPIHIIDKHEIGTMMQIHTIFILAKYYNKKVQINFIDRD